ncbi:MAG: hypothetical protein AAF664_05060 [Planctomycetota bacterium]
MRFFLTIAIAGTFFISASRGMCQETALPHSANVTKDDSGNVTALRVTGKSDQERLPLSIEAIDEISTYTSLTSLSLWGTTIDDAGLERLVDLKNLQMIDLSYTDVTGRSLQTLSNLKNLIYIRLEACDIRDDHLATLAEMPQVAILYLGNTSVSDKGLQHVRGRENLNTLQLSDCKITDAGLASLGYLPQIQHLWLSKTIRYGTNDRSEITDKSVDYLASLDSLIELRISDSKLTEEGLERLREALPKTKISTVQTGVTYLSRLKP